MNLKEDILKGLNNSFYIIFAFNNGLLIYLSLGLKAPILTVCIISIAPLLCFLGHAIFIDKKIKEYESEIKNLEYELKNQAERM